MNLFLQVQKYQILTFHGNHYIFHGQKNQWLIITTCNNSYCEATAQISFIYFTTLSSLFIWHLPLIIWMGITLLTKCIMNACHRRQANATIVVHLIVRDVSTPAHQLTRQNVSVIQVSAMSEPQEMPGLITSPTVVTPGIRVPPLRRRFTHCVQPKDQQPSIYLQKLR